MKVGLVFHDWEKEGKSIYSTLKGVELSMGDFHHGSMFSAEMELDKEQEQELRKAMAQKYVPIFWLYTEEGK